MASLLAQDSEHDCSCLRIRSSIGWHAVECGACKGSRHPAKGMLKWLRNCPECVGVGMLETCCCGARVRLHYLAGACAIATAALGSEASAELDLLRQYRERVVEASSFGRALSRHYNAIKLRAAGSIEQRGLKRFFRGVFITPSIKLLHRKAKCGPTGQKACDVAVYGLFLGGLACATVLHLVGGSPRSEA